MKVDFLNEIGKVAKTVASKTGNMVDVTRLNSKIGSLKDEINGFKIQIGDYIWSKFEAGEPCDAQLNNICGEIKNRLEAIAAVESEIAVIRGSDGQSATEQGETAAFCSSCGMKLAPGTKFCAGCGAKL